jgi:predicted transcriptional regulator
VEDQKSILGILSGMDAPKGLDAPSSMTLGNLAEKNYITISDRWPLFEMVGRMRAEGATIAIVVPKGKPLTGGNVVGVFIREQIADVIEQSLVSYEG